MLNYGSCPNVVQIDLCDLAANSPQRVIVVGGLTGNIVNSSCDCGSNVEVFISMVAFSDAVCCSTSRGVTFLDRRNQIGPIGMFIDVRGKPPNLKRMRSFNDAVVDKESL